MQFDEILPEVFGAIVYRQAFRCVVELVWCRSVVPVATRSSPSPLDSVPRSLRHCRRLGVRRGRNDCSATKRAGYSSLSRKLSLCVENIHVLLHVVKFLKLDRLSLIRAKIGQYSASCWGEAVAPIIECLRSDQCFVTCYVCCRFLYSDRTSLFNILSFPHKSVSVVSNVVSLQVNLPPE